jgi:predicted nucleotidyltransferase
MVRTIRPERPLDPLLLNLLRVMAEEAGDAGIDYMLVGATARDILLTHVFDLPAGRATGRFRGRSAKVPNRLEIG